MDPKEFIIHTQNTLETLIETACKEYREIYLKDPESNNNEYWAQIVKDLKSVNQYMSQTAAIIEMFDN